jgi:hypothetical protein
MSLLTGLLGTFSSCMSHQGMPTGELVSVEYTEHGTAAGYKYYGSVERLENGPVMLKAMKKNYDSIIEKKVDAEVLTHIQNVIKEHKMYKYKESYRPTFQVLDGYSWSFEAKFSDGQKIYSHGSNARPRGDGLDTLKEYMKGLVSDKK